MDAAKAKIEALPACAWNRSMPPTGRNWLSVRRVRHASARNLAASRHYALRKQTVEPVFGIIKLVMGFRQFLLRGKGKVSGEWRLVCLAWNLKRMAVWRKKTRHLLAKTS
ncbi:transposase [Pseudomonas paeninsulae]|uniref:transposase n=1 Tax=Pseudomonas paeninsulae TaxID=3110772 RepID=UPI002D782B99|nr:transposase [Pseudomonas sp. IT1137]